MLTVLNIIMRNVMLFNAPNQQINMISERSCDTEDWSNLPSQEQTTF